MFVRLLLSFIPVQTSVGVCFDMLCNQCMELRQVTPAAEYESSAHHESHRSNRGALFPHRCLVVGRHPRLHYCFIDHVHWRKILFAFPYDLLFLWYVKWVACIRPGTEISQKGSALILNWVSNAVPRPPAKRSVAMGLVNGVGNLGSVCVSHFVLQSMSLEYANWTPSEWGRTFGKPTGVQSTTSR
jgi:hypothetical protein